MADDQLLTPDNTLLSRPNIEPPDGPRAADVDALGGQLGAGLCRAYDECTHKNIFKNAIPKKITHECLMDA